LYVTESHLWRLRVWAVDAVRSIQMESWARIIQHRRP